MYDYLEEKDLFYLISLPKNSRLLELAEPTMKDSRAAYEETGEKTRGFGKFQYAAESWAVERKVIVKAEVMTQGENPRFVVTNMPGDPEALYEEYVDRGDVENRIKELKDELSFVPGEPIPASAARGGIRSYHGASEASVRDTDGESTSRDTQGETPEGGSKAPGDDAENMA